MQSHDIMGHGYAAAVLRRERDRLSGYAAAPFTSDPAARRRYAELLRAITVLDEIARILEDAAK